MAPLLRCREQQGPSCALRANLKLRVATRRPSCVANCNGLLCRTDLCLIDMTGYPYPYYVTNHSGGVCVRECPLLEEADADK